MDNYKPLELLGEGTFGFVGKAVSKKTGEMVAIKILNAKNRHFSEEDVYNLPEVKCLRDMDDHPNIVKLKDVFTKQGTPVLVFEYMESDLQKVMETREANPFSEAEIRRLFWQLFHAVGHMHSQGYFHRDLKPDNFLVSGDRIKIADFGTARKIAYTPSYMELVGTPAYDAPEINLGMSDYSYPVDMWAMGCILAEMYTLTPLFSETGLDQIYQTCRVLGSPTVVSWSKGLELAKAAYIEFPRLSADSLSSLMPSASAEAKSLVRWLLSWDPVKRPTALSALKHPFFASCRQVPRPISSPYASLGAMVRPGARKCAEIKSGASSHHVSNVLSSMKALAV